MAQRPHSPGTALFAASLLIAQAAVGWVVCASTAAVVSAAARGLAQLLAAVRAASAALPQRPWAQSVAAALWLLLGPGLLRGRVGLLTAQLAYAVVVVSLALRGRQLRRAGTLMHAGVVAVAAATALAHGGAPPGAAVWAAATVVTALGAVQPPRSYVATAGRVAIAVLPLALSAAA